MKATCETDRDNTKHVHLCTIGVPEGEETERGLRMYLKKLWLKSSYTKEGNESRNRKQRESQTK